MNAEAGLYFKFDEVNGIPTNCPGLEDFNMDTWTNENLHKDDRRRAFQMACPLNDRKLPESDKSVSEIIQDYADDQDLWIGEFMQAFEKMVANGYDDSALTLAPNSWDKVQCKIRSKQLTCQ